MASLRQHSCPQATVLRRALSESGDHTQSIAIANFARARHSSGCVRSIVLVNCSWRPLESMRGWHCDRRSITSCCRAAYAPPAMHANRGATSSCCPPDPGGDHRAELGALHQALIAGEVEPAFLVARAAALVAAHAAAFENGQYISSEKLCGS